MTSNYEIMATVDISLRVHSIRNLNPQLIGPIFFSIKAKVIKNISLQTINNKIQQYNINKNISHAYQNHKSNIKQHQNAKNESDFYQIHSKETNQNQFKQKLEEQLEQQINAVPYQIIQSKNSLSSIDINYYNTPILILNANENILLNDICVFKVHIPLSQTQNYQLQIICELVVNRNNQLIKVSQFPMKFSSLLNIDTFTPFYFTNYKCSLQASCHTHLISVWNIPEIQSSKLLKRLVDSMVISHNKLRQKLIQLAQHNYKSLPSIQQNSIKRHSNSTQHFNFRQSRVQSPKNSQIKNINHFFNNSNNENTLNNSNLNTFIQKINTQNNFEQSQIVEKVEKEDQCFSKLKKNKQTLNHVKSLGNILKQLQQQDQRQKQNHQQQQEQGNQIKQNLQINQKDKRKHKQIKIIQKTFPHLQISEKMQFKYIFQFMSKRIFKPSQSFDHQNNLSKFLSQFIPQMKIKLLSLWNKYLETLLIASIQNYRKKFFQQFSLITRKICFSQQKINLDKQISIYGVQIAEPSIRMTGSLKVPLQNLKFSKNYKHIFVLVHGFGASTLATSLLQATIKYLFPSILTLNSKANQLQDIDVSQMGRRLAVQVINFIQRQKLQDFELSFIGHSLGGLIIRSALPYLQKYKHFMKHYITMGTPHLGYNYHNSNLVKLGMYFIGKTQQSQVINTLLMRDKNNLKQTFLYNLSKTRGLDWFMTVTFLGSQTDQFVSPQSAMLATSDQILQDQLKGNQSAKLWQQMKSNIDNILKDTSKNKLLIQFSENDKSASIQDKITGRASHVAFLTSKSFINSFLLSLSPLFK